VLNIEPTAARNAAAKTAGLINAIRYPEIAPLCERPTPDGGPVTVARTTWRIGVRRVRQNRRQAHLNIRGRIILSGLKIRARKIQTIKTACNEPRDAPNSCE
tara:strand:- start:2805 stop:3110 length:306 start_codon:yes stop_codon:yes gene_type:complete